MHRFLAPLLVAAIACGGGTQEATPPEATPSGEGFPVTVEAAGGSVEIAERPERIVSMSATATETLFAIGAGDQVVAVDSTSDYPPEAPTSDLSAFEPNVEAVAGHDPDLVVISDDIRDIKASLEALDIPVLMQPAVDELTAAYEQMQQLGLATGHAAEAEDLVASVQQQLDGIAGSIPLFEVPPTYYHELDPTFYTATSETFIGEVYGLVGLRNIADEADDGSGYPQLSAEYIVEANPDLIFLADAECCGESAKTVAERAGWDRMTAVRDGHVVQLDEDIASRWGPRVVDFLETVADAVRDLAA